MDWPVSPDAAPLGDGQSAVAVDRPQSVETLREVVARRAAEGLAIYPQGGRTSLDYGGVPGRPGVAVDITGLDAVIDYPAADMTITVGAGITLARLQEVLATEGQRLPLDTPQPGRATLGGIYATNSSGPRRFGWGRPRDMIIGVSFVTADGKEIKGGGRVVKNVAGYDFPKLLTGSMGTLGILSQMTLKVRPKPEAAALVVIPFDRPGAAMQAVRDLNTSQTRPVALELLNRPASEAMQLGTAAVTLVVGFEDNAASVAWQIGRLGEEVGRNDATFLEGEASLPTWSALADFADANMGAVSFVATLRRSLAVVPVARLLASSWALQVHAGSGVLRGHAIGDWSEQEMETHIGELRSEATRSGGGLIVSRCPTGWKDRLKVWGDRRGDWAIMERIKAALDPGGVMNPGRFVVTI